VVCMHPAVDFTPIYSHAYGSTVHRATVHENVDDDVRRIKTLTPSPTRLTTGTPSQAAPTPVLAAELYNRWAGGAFDDELFAATGTSLLPRAVLGGEVGGEQRVASNILGKASYFPLGVATEGLPSADTDKDDGDAGKTGSQPVKLLHPALIHPDGSLQLFANAPRGTELRLHAGTAHGLVANLAVVGDALDERAPFSRDAVIGSLLFFCGGTMDCVVHDVPDTQEMDAANAVQSAFVEQTASRTLATRKPFLVSHPYGEQYRLGKAWGAPIHANLMFGGVVFGKAMFGMQRRAEVFVSYTWWDRDKRMAQEHQKLVGQIKDLVEVHTRLTCWMDREGRLLPGDEMSDEMTKGVQHADVFLLCLSDYYLESPNCLHELRAALEHNIPIVPLLLPRYIKGYSADAKPPPSHQERPPPRNERDAPWPPFSRCEPKMATLKPIQYVDMRAIDLRTSSRDDDGHTATDDDTLQKLVLSIDRTVRKRRSRRKWKTGKNAAVATLRLNSMAGKPKPIPSEFNSSVHPMVGTPPRAPGSLWKEGKNAAVATLRLGLKAGEPSQSTPALPRARSSPSHLNSIRVSAHGLVVSTADAMAESAASTWHEHET